MSRLIPIRQIPTSLWDQENSIMHLPPELVSCWGKLLDDHGLKEMALTQAPNDIIGGLSLESTNQHLAWRFTGSCARIMQAILDPNEQLNEITDAFAVHFSGNIVFLADLPSGSGATTLSIVSILFELRRLRRIPRHPLKIIVLGGEISEYAQSYSTEALENLKPILETQAIEVSFNVVRWDVCDPFSNADYITRFIQQSQQCRSKVIVIANFSGFLQSENRWDDAIPQIEELFRFNPDATSIFIWLEPQMRRVTNQFLPRLTNFLTNRFRRRLRSNENNIRTSTIQTQHPLREDRRFRNSLAVLRFGFLPWSEQ